MRYRRKGQSVLEFALLLGVVIVVILVMQVFVKRGLQGRLKESADSMGTQFSAGGTTTMQNRTMTSDQAISEETGTKGTTLSDLGYNGTVKGTMQYQAYSASSRTGGNTTSTSQERTNSVKQEVFQYDDLQNTTYPDFNLTGSGGNQGVT